MCDPWSTSLSVARCITACRVCAACMERFNSTRIRSERRSVLMVLSYQSDTFCLSVTVVLVGLQLFDL